MERCLAIIYSDNDTDKGGFYIHFQKQVSTFVSDSDVEMLGIQCWDGIIDHLSGRKLGWLRNKVIAKLSAISQGKHSTVALDFRAYRVESGR